MNIEEFKNKYYATKHIGEERREIFNTRNSVYVVNEISVDIEFIGDSITERFEVYPYFSKYGNIVNRGIGGEPSSKLKERIGIDVLELKPKVCVVAEGVNNLLVIYNEEREKGFVSQELIDKVLTEYREDMLYIVKTLKANNIIPIIGSVLPIGVKDARNQCIIKQNEILKQICLDENVDFVDYYSAYISEDGITMKDLTFGDDLHPHVMGYNEMAKLLYPIFNKLF